MRIMVFNDLKEYFNKEEWSLEILDGCVYFTNLITENLVLVEFQENICGEDDEDPIEVDGFTLIESITIDTNYQICLNPDSCHEKGKIHLDKYNLDLFDKVFKAATNFQSYIELYKTHSEKVIQFFNLLKEFEEVLLKEGYILKINFYESSTIISNIDVCFESKNSINNKIYVTMKSIRNDFEIQFVSREGFKTMDCSNFSKTTLSQQLKIFNEESSSRIYSVYSRSFL